MAEETSYTKDSKQAQLILEDIDWLEDWKVPIKFPDLQAKEAYKGLIRIYISSWLSMYNTFRAAGGTTYEIKEFQELPAGEGAFRISVKLNPPIKKHIQNVKDSGGRLVHLIPPEPPPPPDDKLIIG